MPFGDGKGPLHGRGRGFGKGRGRGRGLGRGLGQGSRLGRGIWNFNRPNPEDYIEQSTDRNRPEKYSKAEELQYLRERKRELEELLKEVGTENKNKRESEEIGKAKVITQYCVGCGVCIPACPENAISVNDVAKINQDLCTGCGNCVSACPRNAIIIE